MRTVILGPTGPGIRTVNIVTSGPDELIETCLRATTGPTGVFETVQPSISADHRFKTLIIADYGGGGGLPAPPAGYAYIVNAGGSYLLNADGSYILTKVT